ncbi:hypothetical protein ACSBR2_032772 [Camellia fascicularis]
MVMDPSFTEFSDPTQGFKFNDDSFFPTFDQSENLSNMFQFKDDLVDLNSIDLSFLPPDSPNPGFVAPISSTSSEVDSQDDNDYSNNLLNYINSILMEENMEQKPSMFDDPLALQETEKSLYDVLGSASPNELPPLYFNHPNIESPDFLFCSSSEQSTASNISGSNSIDSQCIVDTGEQKLSVQSYTSGYPFETTLKPTLRLSFDSTKSFSDDSNGLIDPSMSSHLVSNIFSNSESILQFNRGMEEAKKFLPKNNPLVIDLDALPPESEERASEVVVKVEEGRESSPNGLRGRKNHHREDSDLEEERSSKQSAVYVESVEEAELSALLDKVLLCTEMRSEIACCNGDEEEQSEATKTSQQNGQPHGSSGAKTRAKKQGNKNEVVDLRTLLINCAQSVATDDHRTANEQLKQIRQHASPFGNGSQRVAYIFANGLEARLAGTGSQIYANLASKRITAAEKLKAYQLYLSAAPFKMISTFFSNKMILDLAMNSTKKKLHIIDFGILYGFQWPILIQYLSALPGGAPELRITGIELPQLGFRPAELVEETGHRLAKYCERFNVRFQYHAIAQKWETIKIEDLNIQSDEVLAVNSLFRFRILPDETVDVDSPRDAVLKLIRKMNPDIFTHTIVNGSYNAPFFVTRFREALFYYSSMFDIFDITMPREGQERVNLERVLFGREVMNIIACEGAERVERPETYKQWQARTMRAGFKMLPLEQETLNKFRGKVKKAGYHKDFVIDEDGQWMLQGWRGKIFCASSCWVPA